MNLILNHCTKNELLGECAKLHLEVNKRLTKNQLIQLLYNHLLNDDINLEPLDIHGITIEKPDATQSANNLAKTFNIIYTRLEYLLHMRRNLVNSSHDAEIQLLRKYAQLYDKAYVNQFLAEEEAANQRYEARRQKKIQALEERKKLCTEFRNQVKQDLHENSMLLLEARDELEFRQKELQKFMRIKERELGIDTLNTTIETLTHNAKLILEREAPCEWKHRFDKDANIDLNVFSYDLTKSRDTFHPTIQNCRHTIDACLLCGYAQEDLGDWSSCG